MQNDPELNGKYLGTITTDFIKVADTLKEASYQMRKREISNFPIFPISKIEIPIGSLLIGRGEAPDKNSWHYYVSMMDEFVQRQLIDKDKIEDFKSAYKDADEFCCLFVVDVQFTNFVFIPYPED